MDVSALQQIIDEHIPLLKVMGVQIRSLGPAARTFLPFKPENRNHIGSQYAGALFSLAEMTAGVALFATFPPHEYWIVIKDVTIRFRKPATADVEGQLDLDPALIEQVHADLAANGKSARQVPVTLWCGDLKVAEADVTFYLQPHK